MRFPWVVLSRKRCENLAKLQTENYVLRDALREANAELLRHRTLIAGLASGRRDMTEALERILSK